MMDSKDKKELLLEIKKEVLGDKKGLYEILCKLDKIKEEIDEQSILFEINKMKEEVRLEINSVFGDSFDIHFILDKTDDIIIESFDILGRRIINSINKKKNEAI